jgi:two-component system sensor histidine kinase TctE
VAPRKSLRSTLLLWLLLPLAAVTALDTWVTFESATRTATLVQDRLLLGSARSIAERVQVSNGQIVVTIPPAAIELLDAGFQDRVYYRVVDSAGKLLAGNEELGSSLPTATGGPEEWVAFDSVLRNQDVRVVTFSQPLFEALNRGPVLIEVAQTLHGRAEFARTIWLHAARQQALMLLLVGGLLWLGLRRGLMPLTALRNRMLRRQPGAVESIDEASVPTELEPLVAALNEYVLCLNDQMLSHSRFIADASHQLRTPLTVLNTQIAFAMRQSDPATAAEVLTAIHHSVQASIRLVNQLLAVTEAESASRPVLKTVPIDLCQSIAAALEELASLAQAKNIDLGFEASDESLTVLGVPHMLHMLVVNLVDNAIRYTHEGGMVTVRAEAHVDGSVAMTVVDNGPGIPESERDSVFERFYRLLGKESDGCGLGLAIVKEVAVAHGATWKLSAPQSGTGLVVTVTFQP